MYTNTNALAYTQRETRIHTLTHTHIQTCDCSVLVTCHPQRTDRAEEREFFQLVSSFPTSNTCTLLQPNEESWKGTVLPHVFTSWIRNHGLKSDDPKHRCCPILRHVQRTSAVRSCLCLHSGAEHIYIQVTCFMSRGCHLKSSFSTFRHTLV